MTNRLVSLIFVLAVASSAACGGVTVREEIDPTATARERCQRRVGDALEQARQAEEELDAVTFRLRYNPVECDCPGWEIELRGDWTRIALVTDSEELTQALLERATADEQAGAFAIYAVVGGLGHDWTTASTGMRYRTLHIIEWIGNAETVDRQQVDE